MTDRPTYTITLQPWDRRFVDAYETGPDFAGNGRPRYGIGGVNADLLPEEVRNEIRLARDGTAWLLSFRRPVVDHIGGWQSLEEELRRMEATNQRPDAMFKDAVIGVTFEMFYKEPSPHSRFTTPLLICAVTRIKILGHVEDARGAK